MKALKIILAIIIVSFYNFAFAQTVVLNCESHEVNKSAGMTNNQQYDLNRCWMFTSKIIYSIVTKITGNYSAVSTGTLSSTPGVAQIRSPWVRLSSGNITFKTKLTASSGTTRKIQVNYAPYDAGKSLGEGTEVLLYTYNWTSINTTANTITIPVPGTLANSGTYKIKYYLMGTGGTSNIVIDDISIPGTYDSDVSACSGNPLSIPKDPDTDSDGVKDSEDAYPNDALRAYNTFTPASGTGTLLFEDLWPSLGDYDFNDLVLAYRYQKVTNALNNVVELKATIITKAIGGSFHNGFAIQLNGVTSGQVVSVTGVKTFNAGWLSVDANGTEKGQTNANIIIFDDAYKVLPFPGGSFVNTYMENPYQTPDTTKVVITFTANQVSASSLVINPYIIVDQDRGKEIHLPNFAPSLKVNTTLFGQFDDNTTVGTVYYKSKTNLPWVLDIPASMIYPQEQKDFISVYLNFVGWAQSNGLLNPDWYLSNTGNINSSNAYTK